MCSAGLHIFQLTGFGITAALWFTFPSEGLSSNWISAFILTGLTGWSQLTQSKQPDWKLAAEIQVGSYSPLPMRMSLSSSSALSSLLLFIACGRVEPSYSCCLFFPSYGQGLWERWQRYFFCCYYYRTCWQLLSQSNNKSPYSLVSLGEASAQCNSVFQDRRMIWILHYLVIPGKCSLDRVSSPFCSTSCLRYDLMVTSFRSELILNTLTKKDCWRKLWRNLRSPKNFILMKQDVLMKF